MKIIFFLIGFIFSIQAHALPAEDWSSKATRELESARLESVKPKAVKVANKSAKSKVKTVNPIEPVAVPVAAPTPATVVVEVAAVRPAIERTALRFGLLVENYQPHGSGRVGVGETVTYDRLPSAPMANVDFRWLPFDLGDVAGRSLTFGGYVGGGFSRQTMPLVSPTGFRYDDVALNTLRYEAGPAIGMALSSRMNLEVRGGIGKISAIQTSRFSNMVGTFDRTYAVGAIDVSYHFVPRFALMASAAYRSPISSGSVAFDRLAISGGLLVQVR